MIALVVAVVALIALVTTLVGAHLDDLEREQVRHDRESWARLQAELNRHDDQDGQL